MHDTERLVDSSRWRRLWLLLATLALCLSPGSEAGADTIYLKNGRVIHSEWTRVEGEHLVFLQYGGEVKIPLQAVERVEKDDEQAPAPSPTPSQEEYRAELVRRYAEAGLSSPVREEAGGAPPAGDAMATGAAAGFSTDRGRWRNLSPDTREYWQLRAAEIHEQIARVQAEIDRLPKYNYFEEKILDGRILWVIQEKERLEARIRDLETRLLAVREDARKAGIPPGWLRAPVRER